MAVSFKEARLSALSYSISLYREMARPSKPAKGEHHCGHDDF
jgi:hypothetical protein